jgi:hypothetical protein
MANAGKQAKRVTGTMKGRFQDELAVEAGERPKFPTPSHQSL